MASVIMLESDDPDKLLRLINREIANGGSLVSVVWSDQTSMCPETWHAFINKA